MVGLTLLESLLVVVAAQAPQDPLYSVRNATTRSFTCGLKRQHGRQMSIFLLRRGTEWSGIEPDSGRRTLLCDTRTPTQRFPIRAGLRYELVEREGQVVLRQLAP